MYRFRGTNSGHFFCTMHHIHGVVPELKGVLVRTLRGDNNIKYEYKGSQKSSIEDGYH